MEKRSVRIPGIEYEYQYRLPVEEVTSTSLFDGGLREAQALFKSRVHRHMDGWARFDRLRNGFAGLVMEMKSGNQGIDAPIFQLKCYREALRRCSPEPMVVWGIFERPTGDEVFAQVTERLSAAVGSPAEDDVWVFSTADEIPQVLKALGLTER